MKNDKTKKIIIWTIIIVVAMTLAEIGIRAIVSSTQRFIAQKHEEKAQKEILNSEESKKERELFDIILKIIEAANNNDYAYVMEKLDSSYSLCFFGNSIEALKTYFIENIPKTDEILLANVSSKGYIYKVIIGFGTGSDYTTRIFTLMDVDDGYKVMLDDYDSVVLINETTNIDGIEYTIRYKYVSNNIISYVIDVANTLDKKVKIEINNTILVLSNGKEVIGNNEHTFELNSNNTQALEMFFKKTDYGVYHIKMNAYVNEEEYNLQLGVN